MQQRVRPNEVDVASPLAYLADLNPQQRRAVEYGCDAPADASPLLIIAGAGSGKTNTLAHRVAHLIVCGADPRRIMLLTFSRRAAAEMQRRVERITGKVMGTKASVMTDALAWSGTFHAVGARLLREYATDIGIENSFTIHDREDSADLMNLIRHDLDFSKTDKRFPLKGTCLAIYSRSVNAEIPLAAVLGDNRGVQNGRVNYADCLRPMSRRSKSRTCSTMTIYFSIGPR